jgi:RHS repeat-associated protein
VQNLNYAWNAVGSLTSRQDANQSLTETFAYDNIHRLDYSQLNGNTNLDLSYQANGNISWRSDVGSYTYHGTKIHAVTAAGGLSFSYDANGNLTTRSGASVTWYASNQPQTISNGSYSSTFEYGPNRHYWKQTATYSNGTETTRYIGGLLEIVQGPSVTSWRHQILAAGRTVAVYSRGSNGSNNTIYPLRDHLGSTEAITNASGAILVKTSFAAYGARRGSNWTGSPSGAEMSAIGDATRRGYTDHTMLDNLGLVHMNGRVFDPAIGRFMSADPFIDGVLDTQGWNRFSYVKNNPLTSTDPSGFTALSLRRDSVQMKPPWMRPRNGEPPDFSCAIHCGPPNRELNGDGGGDSLPSVTITARRDKSQAPATTTVSGSRAGRVLAPVLPTQLARPTLGASGLAPIILGGFVLFGCGDSAQSPSCRGALAESDEPTDGERPQPASPPDLSSFENPGSVPAGWRWEGRGEPGSREGAWHNPSTGESLHDDRTHPEGKAPHWTYTDPDGKRWDNYGDGWIPVPRRRRGND